MNKNLLLFIIYMNILNTIYATHFTTKLSFDPCKFADCGENFFCVRNLSKPNGYECKEQLTNDNLKLNTTQGSCLINSCQNGGICKINKILNIPLCICKSPYIGSNCEINSEERNNIRSFAFYNSPTVSNYVDRYYNSFHNSLLNYPNNQLNLNPCETYNLLGISVCKNGGYCSTTSPIIGKVNCICPITHTGEFCEKELYTQCPTVLSLCHTNNGKCVNGNVCVCVSGYHGKRCDETDKCKSSYCLNGGSCEQRSAPPFRVCLCTKSFNGTRCETPIATASSSSSGSSSGSGSSLSSAASSRCNYTISILNEGAFFARIRVSYTAVNGIRQAAIMTKTVRFIGEQDNLIIPYTSTDVVVKLEAYNGIFWETIHDDAYLGIDKECVKCYKVWGTITDAKWDYIFC